ncbi:flagellar basal body rod protein FlgC, partial [Achromobacter sp.]|uniref:flagellar basal body rod protein FlgC n=1 Tax=Achromobacter sp. TaxID=134375 RepID=UPI0028AAFA9F
GGPDGQPYRARQVVFQVNPAAGQALGQEIGGVRVAGVIQDPSPLKQVYDPKHPLADAQGYISMPNVDPVAETVNMIAASRSYQANVEVLNTAKALMQKTLTIGQS